MPGAVITVAVLAESTRTRARLEALVAARPGWRLIAAPAAEARLEADVLVLDPGARAVEAALRPLARHARLPAILVLGGAAPPVALPRLLRAGLRGLLPRDAAEPEIAAAIEALAAGLVVLHPATTRAAGARPALRASPDEARPEPLTPRELEVLTMMAEGLGNRAIARSLGISVHTVKFHVAAVLDKLGARSRAEAVAVGLRRGLLMV